MAKFAKLFSVLLILLVVVGCSKPPEMEMKAANAAMDQAKGAEAQSYVGSEFRALNDSLNAANAAKTEQDGKFALFRSYAKSKDMFVRVEALGKKVASDAAAEKERVKNEVTQLLATAKATLDSADAAVKKAPVGKGNKADIELIKNDLASALSAYDDANNDFNNGKYLVARTKVQSVQAKAEGILTEVQAAYEKAHPGKKMPAAKAAPAAKGKK